MLRMSGILMTEISVSNVKKINHGHGVPIMPKQRERCHSFFIAAVVLNQCFGDLGKLPTLLVLPQIPCEQQLLIELAINSGDFW
jgi:hypothetical protein